MNVLIDTNVVLDVLLGREPFVTQSAKVIAYSAYHAHRFP
jgi:hypothetical protein